LRFLGTGGDTTPDYLDPPIEPGLVEPVTAALVGHVVSRLHCWDALQLSDLDPSATFTRALIHCCRQMGCLVESRTSAQIPYGPLPLHWEDYLASLSAHRRQTVRQIRRRFERSDGARFRLCNTSSEVPRLFERLAQLHCLRFSARGERHSFSSPEYLGFHGELVRALHARGSLRLYVLESAATVVAVLYCFRHGHTMFYFQGGFEPAYGRWSVGQLLVGYAIESAIAEGCLAFDMLRGDHDHKRHFFKDTRGTIEVRAFRPGWSTWSHRVGGLLRRTRTLYLGLLATARSIGADTQDWLGRFATGPFKQERLGTPMKPSLGRD
jgi:hypothetical protein